MGYIRYAGSQLNSCTYSESGKICIEGDLYLEGWLPLLPESPCPQCNECRYERYIRWHEHIKARFEAQRALETHYIANVRFDFTQWDMAGGLMLAQTLSPHPTHAEIASLLKTAFPELADWPVSALVPTYAEFILEYKSAFLAEYSVKRDPGFLGFINTAVKFSPKPSLGQIYENVYELHTQNVDKLKPFCPAWHK